MTINQQEKFTKKEEEVEYLLTTVKSWSKEDQEENRQDCFWKISQKSAATP